MEENITVDVVLADKNPLILSGLSQLLNADERFNVVATAADGERFMDAVRRIHFDIGVMGWDMPFMDGREVLLALAEETTPPRMVVYTGNAATHIARQVMQLGGAGFCSKSDRPERLLDILVSVFEGRMVFPFMDMRQRDDDPLNSLTAREHELLASLAHGMSNAGIATELNISLNTVKFHLKNLYSKLDVSNRAQAVACYLKAQTGRS